MKTNDRSRTFWYVAFSLAILAAFILQPQAWAQMTSTGIDCSQIAALHLLQQDNMRAGAALIECGVIQGGTPAGAGDEVAGDEPQPPNILVSNRNCTSASSCTKSESMVWPAQSRAITPSWSTTTTTTAATIPARRTPPTAAQPSPKSCRRRLQRPRRELWRSHRGFQLQAEQVVCGRPGDRLRWSGHRPLDSRRRPELDDRRLRA